QRNILCLVTSTQSERNGLAYAIRPERAQERTHMTDWFTIPGNDDVALVNARLGRWSLRLDFHHHHASSPALDRDELEAKAKRAAGDVSVFLKLRRDTLNGSRGNHYPATARSEPRHVNRPARRINRETALRALPHVQIEFDPSIDLAAA